MRHLCHDIVDETADIERSATWALGPLALSSTGCDGGGYPSGSDGVERGHAGEDVTLAHRVQHAVVMVVRLGGLQGDQAVSKIKIDTKYTRSGHQLNSILLTFLNQGSERSAFSTNAQSRFASVVVDGVLGPLRLARHT